MNNMSMFYICMEKSSLVLAFWIINLSFFKVILSLLLINMYFSEMMFRRFSKINMLLDALIFNQNPLLYTNQTTHVYFWLYRKIGYIAIYKIRQKLVSSSFRFLLPSCTTLILKKCCSKSFTESFFTKYRNVNHNQYVHSKVISRKYFLKGKRCFLYKILIVSYITCFIYKRFLFLLFNMSYISLILISSNISASLPVSPQNVFFSSLQHNTS